ncbi:hypothetical protein KFK09_011240 [Dendrobium nobile]|uniref:Thioredoxin-like fold domain-containing protein MRL7L, chloroplastic n=1 Tax=Dendrobium nobile TaxID=94219 RepID=A0A8T3BC51_DENNO|nr:hypothetical protein KFK09_011240 [Dendrobium nobile]
MECVQYPNSNVENQLAVSSIRGAARMALNPPLLLRCSTLCLTETSNFQPSPFRSSIKFVHSKNQKNCTFHLLPLNIRRTRISRPRPLNASKKFFQSSESDTDEEDADPNNKYHRVAADPYLMTEEERLEMRRKIMEVLDSNPVIEEEIDPVQRKIKMQRLLADYPLVAEEDDPDWPDDADGWGFKFDQFFNNIRIKNVRKEDDEGYDSEKEIVWQDDDYIKPIRDITTREWEDTVFKNFNPCIILVHNRYKRPKENVRARDELEKAVKLFWETGLPSPRCVAVDAVVEDELAEALHVSIFPEIIFTKAGKILHRDKVVRNADEWSKMIAFFYYKAVRPSCLDKAAGVNKEKIPSLR